MNLIERKMIYFKECTVFIRHLLGLWIIQPEFRLGRAGSSRGLLPEGLPPVKVGQAVADDIQNTTSCRVWKLSETRSNYQCSTMHVGQQLKVLRKFCYK